MEKTALLLDDDSLCRSLMTELLEEENVKVTSFSDPSAYFKKYGQHAGQCHFDYIVTDNQMPGMTGLDFLLELKKRGCTPPDDCLAVISGSWSESEIHQASSIGCRVFSKPQGMIQLNDWIGETRQRHSV